MPGDENGHNGRPRAPQRGKVISLQGHQAAEQALDALVSADPRDPEYERLVAEAVDLGAPLPGAIVRHLDSSRPQRLYTLGRVAAAYPLRIQMVQTLLRAASDRRNSDSRRLGAILVLGQHLGVQPAEDFLLGLRNPTAAATSYLLANLTQYSARPEMLLGSFRALVTLPPEVLFAIIGVMGESPTREAVLALQLLALVGDAEIAEAAIEALTARHDPEAQRALAVLEHNVSPDASASLSRHLQKQRLSGMYADPLRPAPPTARALVSAVDGRGNRVLWFAVPLPMQSRDAAFVGLQLNDAVGIVDAAGVRGQSVRVLPPRVPLGTLHNWQFPRIVPSLSDAPVFGAIRHYLEISFGHGLRIARDAVQQTWDSGGSLPFAYQVLVDLPWQYAPSLEEDTGAAATLADDNYADDVAALLANPAFHDWYLDSASVYMAAQELISQDLDLPGGHDGPDWRALLPIVIKLARAEFVPQVRARYARRLEQMAEWLLLSGQAHEARLAATAARTMFASPPEANLFVLSLIQRGIVVAARQLTASSLAP